LHNKGGEDMTEQNAESLEKEYLNIVKNMVQEVRYGQIAIIVQDGKIVQIEQNKKIRIKN
jgi:hypothetical protein